MTNETAERENIVLPPHEYRAALTLIHWVAWGEPRTVDGPDLLSPKYLQFMIGHVARNSDAYRKAFKCSAPQ